MKWRIPVNQLRLCKPSIDQCQEVIRKLKDYYNLLHFVELSDSSPDNACLLMSHLLDVRRLECIHIYNTKITKDVILLLSHKITNHTSLDTLVISEDSIDDDGVIALTQSLINNKTITDLYLGNNPDITSTSAQSIAELLLYNDTLSGFRLIHNNIDTDGVLVLMESLRTNNTMETIELDMKHEEACSSLPYYETIKNKINFRY